MEWVPAYLDLWVDNKAGLSHATRSIFLRLCLSARRARRDGYVPLSPTATSNESAVHAIVGGKLTESKVAVVELLAHAMVAFEEIEGDRVLRVLSWEDWALGRQEPTVDSERSPKPKSPAAERARRWRENRKAVRPAATPDPDPNDAERSPNAFANAPNGSVNGTEPFGEHSPNGVERSQGGGKGGALPPFQKREEEIKVEENTGEGEARASAGGTPPASTRKGRLLASLRQSSDLAELEATKQLDLERVARDLGDNGANYVIGGKLREDEVDERLDAVVRDLVREAAAAASTSRPMPPLEVARKAHTFATATLGKSREEWGKRQSQTTGTPGQGEDLRKVIDIFASMWSARKKHDYVQADGAERHAQKLVDAARQNASKRAGLQPSAIVRHWVSQYLADVSDRKIVDEEHPLSFLPSRIDRYGLPKSEKPPVPQAKTNAAPETASGPAPLDMLKRLQQPSNDVDSMMTRPSAPRAGGT